MTASHLRPDGDAIGLAPDRCGADRGSELGGRERALYRWILRHFAAEGPPTTGQIAVAAAGYGLEAEVALRRMEALDLVQRGAQGEVACAYPFSARPTGHTVELEDGAGLVHAMCAVDALGIPFMLRRGGAVCSTDPATGHPLRVTIDQAGTVRAQPADPVALVARTLEAGPLASSCCPLINLFESRDAAQLFLDRRRDLHGAVLSLPEAVAVARAVFEGVLGEAQSGGSEPPG